MKRLLLIFSLMIPAWLYSCSGTKPPVPTPIEVIEEAHEAIREIPLTKPEPEAVPALPPQVKKHDHPTSARPVPRPRPRVVLPRPPAREAAVEALPPQEGLICIFPFGLVPTCTPEPAGRMP